MPISSAGLALLKRTVIGALLLSKFKNCEHLEYLRDFYSVVPNHDKDLASKPQINSNLQYQKNSRKIGGINSFLSFTVMSTELPKQIFPVKLVSTFHPPIILFSLLSSVLNLLQVLRSKCRVKGRPKVDFKIIKFVYFIILSFEHLKQTKKLHNS